MRRSASSLSFAERRESATPSRGGDPPKPPTPRIRALGGAHRARYSRMGTYVFVSGSRTHPSSGARHRVSSASSPAFPAIHRQSSSSRRPGFAAFADAAFADADTGPSRPLTDRPVGFPFASVTIGRVIASMYVCVAASVRSPSTRRALRVTARSTRPRRAPTPPPRGNRPSRCAGESPSGWRRRARDARRNTPRGVFSPPLRLLRESPASVLAQISSGCFSKRGRGGAGAGASAAGSRAHATGADAAMGARDASAAADVSIRDATSASSDAFTSSRSSSRTGSGTTRLSPPRSGTTPPLPLAHRPFSSGASRTPARMSCLALGDAASTTRSARFGPRRCGVRRTRARAASHVHRFVRDTRHHRAFDIRATRHETLGWPIGERARDGRRIARACGSLTRVARPASFRQSTREVRIRRDAATHRVIAMWPRSALARSPSRHIRRRSWGAKTSAQSGETRGRRDGSAAARSASAETDAHAAATTSPRRCASWSARRRARAWRNWTRTARFRGAGEDVVRGRVRGRRPRTRPGRPRRGSPRGIVERGVVGGRRGRGGVRVGVRGGGSSSAAVSARMPSTRARANHRALEGWERGRGRGRGERVPSEGGAAAERFKHARGWTWARTEPRLERIQPGGGQDVHVPIARPSGRRRRGDIARATHARAADDGESR